MKLTAKQQYVVSKLKIGWMLHVHGLLKDGGGIGEMVHHKTLYSLRDQGIIYHDFSSDYYKLDLSKIC